MPASFSTILDTFDSNSISALWTVGGYTSPVFASQQLQLTIAASSTSITGMQSVANYDLTGVACSCQVVDAGPQSFSGWTVVPLFILLDFSNELYFQIVNNLLVAYTTIAGITVAHSTVTYNATNHQFLQIREQSGTIYWDTSADGKTWTNLTSLPNPFAVTALYMSFLVETGSSNTVPMTAKIDNFNVVQSASNDGCSLVDAEHVAIFFNFTVTDSIVGSEISGSTRKLIVSRNPTEVGIAGIIQVVYPPYPEFVFGPTSSGLVSASISDSDSCVGTDSISSRTFFNTDSVVFSDFGQHITSLMDVDFSTLVDSVITRTISTTESISGFELTSNINVTGLIDVDSSVGTDLGTQSFSLTHTDSSVMSESATVTIGLGFSSNDSIHFSENQSVRVALSAIETAVGTEILGNRTLTNSDSSQTAENIARNIGVSDSSLGTDLGFVAISSVDSCATTDQASLATIVTSIDSSTETEVTKPLALSTLSESIVLTDAIGARSLVVFETSQGTETVGNRTMFSADSIQESDAGIHGNFVFNFDSAHATESFNYPVYHPAATDSILGSDTSLLATTVNSSDSIVGANNQSFTIIVFEHGTLTDSGVPNNVTIADTDHIGGNDLVGSRTFSSSESISASENIVLTTKISSTEPIHTTDIGLLFVPISQNDRVQGTDNSAVVFANISDSQSIGIIDASALTVKITSTETTHENETSSLVETPVDPNRTITVTESCRGIESAKIVLVITNTSFSNMSEFQMVVRRSIATDTVAFQTEKESLRAVPVPFEFIHLTENAVVVRTSSAADLIQGVDGQQGSSVDLEHCVITDIASVVEYVPLDMTVWAYGEVLMSS